MSERTMMDDGGPAFPTDAQSALQHDHYEGMSLRDWFAGQAVPGLLTARIASDGDDSVWLWSERGVGWNHAMPPSANQLATLAYELADAMLLARKPTTTP